MIEISTIFALEEMNERLWTVVYKNSFDSAYDDFYETHTDVSYLEEYFETNKDKLKRAYPTVTVSQAILDTIDGVNELHDFIIELTEKDTEDDLEDLFIPFHKKYETKKLTESKAYGILFKKSWIRLFAIRIDYNLYVITGGGIKLVAATQQDERLTNEVDKMEAVRNYLLKEGVIEEGEIDKL